MRGLRLRQFGGTAEGARSSTQARPRQSAAEEAQGLPSRQRWDPYFELRAALAKALPIDRPPSRSPRCPCIRTEGFAPTHEMPEISRRRRRGQAEPARMGGTNKHRYELAFLPFLVDDV